MATSEKNRCLRALLFSCLVLLVDYNYDALSKVRTGVSLLLYPLTYAVSKPAEYADLAMNYLQRQIKLVKNNEQLRHELFQAQAEVQRFAAMRSENERLRELLAATRVFERPTLLAELMGIDRQPLRQQLTIDRGAGEGVVIGQAVVDAFGIMGQVVHVEALSSRVLLITDPLHALPVRIDRSGVRMVALGRGGKELLLEYLPPQADIKVGDLVVSSGLGEAFPANYPVGHVSRVERQVKGVSPPKVYVVPTARIETSREFLLVRSGG
ncbi:MAG: rod shape-determining protein MreC [Candidatus Porifericomitaceae bacterium WSBS_2022_MAG_OTU9]